MQTDCNPVTQKGWEGDDGRVPKNVRSGLKLFDLPIHALHICCILLLMDINALYWVADALGNTCDCLQHFKCVTIVRNSGISREKMNRVFGWYHPLYDKPHEIILKKPTILK